MTTKGATIPLCRTQPVVLAVLVSAACGESRDSDGNLGNVSWSGGGEDASPERSAQFGFKRVFWAFRSAHGMRA